MALLEVFCNAFAAFLNHADDINLWPAVQRLAALSTAEDGANSKLQMDPNDGISKEFMEIKAYGLHVRQEFPQLVGQLPENKDKNRYRDIIPFDKSRVIIDEAGTYINASLIEGLLSCASYVAAQAPLPGQVNDFWRMVIRYRCPAIVMLCDLVEAGRGKCVKYWPDEIGMPQPYGNITVTLVAEERLPSANQNVYTPVCRIFEIFSTTADGRPLLTRCRQYQLSGWPDHGVPPTSAITSLIDLASLLIHTYPPSPHRNNIERHEEQSPLLIHCSAGCGRSGVFISLHQVCVLLKLHQLDSNLFGSGLAELVKSLRYQRPSMVQTFDQYVFLYQMVATLLRRVSRSCLRRLAKMGVSVVGAEDLDGRDAAVNSPSPPPPKPPDPFSNNSNSSVGQKTHGQQSVPSSHQPVASGRLFATDIASDLVTAQRSSDWAILRRVSFGLARTLNQAIQPLLSSPAMPRPAKPSLVAVRRASTAETPAVTRRSVGPNSPPMAASLAVDKKMNVSARSPNEKPPLTSIGGNGQPSSVQYRPNRPDDLPALSRLEGVEKQLAQLVMSGTSGSPVSPSSRRPTHRRQLSGSYDNIAEMAAAAAASDTVVTTHEITAMSTPSSVKTFELPSPLSRPTKSLSIAHPPQPPASAPLKAAADSPKIIVDLSNISPPPPQPLSPLQQLLSIQQQNGVIKKESPVIEPLPYEPLPPATVSMPMAPTQPLPPPPPRRRRLTDDLPHQHHMSFAHLVLEPNQASPPETHHPPAMGESATLGRPSVLSPRTGPVVISDGLRYNANGVAAPTTKIFRNMDRRPLLRQGSLIFKTSPATKLLTNQPVVVQQHETTPLNADLAGVNSPKQAPPDLNPYASLGRFRSVAQVGLSPSRSLDSTRRPLDNHHPHNNHHQNNVNPPPPTAPKPQNREPPASGRSI